MSRFQFKLPDIGEGVTEGEVVTWHVNVGDRVREDQLMVEVMTDKATVTIGAPKSGKVAELPVGVGDKVKVGEVLVVIETGNGGVAARSPSPQRTAAASPAAAQAGAPAPAPAQGGQTAAATAVGDIRDSLPGVAHFAARQPAPERGANGGEHSAGGYYQAKPLATPATRKLARDLGIDLRRVQPSGSGGRVTKEDVLGAQEPASRSAAQPAPPAPAAQPPDQAPAAERVPFVGLRRTIAERMQTAKNTAAHFTFVEECEVDRLMEIRERLAPQAEQRGVELTYLAFVVKATVAALHKHRMLNAHLDAEANELVIPHEYNIGVAVATEQGLVVPVIHRAERLSVLEVASEIGRLSQAARANSLSVTELRGSTFTITSLGKQGGLLATPVINLPNVGILGVHRIKQRPVVRDGQIAVGHVMLLSLSLDHRIIDGHVGAAFAYDVIAYLEDPAKLLVELR